jgi:hypothetical protein
MQYILKNMQKCNITISYMQYITGHFCNGTHAENAINGLNNNIYNKYLKTCKLSYITISYMQHTRRNFYKTDKKGWDVMSQYYSNFITETSKKLQVK